MRPPTHILTDVFHQTTPRYSAPDDSFASGRPLQIRDESNDTGVMSRLCNVPQTLVPVTDHWTALHIRSYCQKTNTAMMPPPLSYFKA